MNLDDERKFEEMRTVTTLVKDGAINLLGLNGAPIEDEETGLLRPMGSGEFLPLALLIGRDDVLQGVHEQWGQYRNQEEERAKLQAEGIVTGVKPKDAGVNEMTPDELDEFMEMEPEFDNTPEELQQMMNWGSPDTQFYLENLVMNKDDIDEHALERQPARTVGRARKDLINKVKAEQQEERDRKPVSMPIQIESDSILEQTPEKRVKSRITLETVED